MAKFYKLTMISWYLGEKNKKKLEYNKETNISVCLSIDTTISQGTKAIIWTIFFEFSNKSGAKNLGPSGQIHIPGWSLYN